MIGPFSLVYPILAADDFTFANLEVVFTNRTKHQDKRYPLASQAGVRTDAFAYGH